MTNRRKPELVAPGSPPGVLHLSAVESARHRRGGPGAAFGERPQRLRIDAVLDLEHALRKGFLGVAFPHREPVLGDDGPESISGTTK